MNIIITGASRGIGYEAVKLAALDPENTVIAISRNSTALSRMAAESQHGNIHAVAFDISSPALEKDILLYIQDKVGHVDILINNAGALINKPFSSITASELHYVYNVNVFAPFLLIRALMPLMGTVRTSHVVNISSMGGFQGSAKFPGLSAYSSSKAAIAGLTECLAEEFKEKNIRMNCLALGAVQTEMLSEAFPGYKATLSASQMAEFVIDFSLKAHHYLNGKIIPVSLSTP
jgi:3-oxoacyl-[acyl-carrier protein] reductase